MKKIVINTVHGGFSLSASGLKRWAELKGKPCYFYYNDINGNKYTPLTVEEADSKHWFSAYTTEDPERDIPSQDNWHEMTDEQKEQSNQVYRKYSLCNRDIPRDDPDLIKVVKELKKKASGKFASLKVVSIPDDVNWEIGEYDGLEWVEEVHRKWY